MDRLIATIKQLPRVLQNEIWEYVHGDRKHWKNIFIEQVLPSIQVGYTFRGRHWNIIQKSERFGPFQIRVLKKIDFKGWRVALYQHDLQLVHKDTDKKLSRLFNRSVAELAGRWERSECDPYPSMYTLSRYGTIAFHYMWFDPNFVRPLLNNCMSLTDIRINIKLRSLAEIMGGDF